MKILVVGGAGYIGSHMVRELLDKGYDPLVLDNLSTGHADAVPEGRLLIGDLADTQGLRQLLSTQHFDAVMHFASFIQVGESVENPLKYYYNNVANSINLLKEIERAGIRRFVFSSTAAVYGCPTEIPISETASLKPENPYGHSKLVLENILADCEKAWGIKSACLRYFNAAGAHPSADIGELHEPESHLIPIILEVASGLREFITVNGDDYDTPDGTCIRDYIHVCDLAEAHTLALDKLMKDDASVLYNLGNGKGYSINDVIEVCRNVTGHSIPAKVGPRRSGDPAKLVASSEKIIRELHWKPQFADLESIVRSAWEFVKRVKLHNEKGQANQVFHVRNAQGIDNERM